MRRATSVDRNGILECDSAPKCKRCSILPRYLQRSINQFSTLVYIKVAVKEQCLQSSWVYVKVSMNSFQLVRQG